MSDIIFSKLTWENLPARTTALSAQNLNRIEKGIDDSVNGVNANSHSIAELQTRISQIASGTPEPANTIAEMTDHSKIYVYTGSEQGESTGYWYSYDSTQENFVPRGEYGGAVTSTTFTEHDVPADDFAVGQALADKADADDLTALETTVAGKADSSDVTALDTRVTEVEGDVESLKEDLNILTDKNLEFVETATAGATNAYKVIENKLLVGVEYAFKVTPRTAGTYLFQAGIGQSASSMYDIGTYTFSAGETKTITGYSTNNRNIKYFRLYSADVSLENMDWDVSVYTYYDAQKEISDVSERVDTEINDANERIMVIS